MREWIDLMEWVGKMAPTTLYHGTYESNLPSIMKHGLMWEKSRSSIDAVFLAGDVHTARNYSSHHDPEDGVGSGRWVVLAIDVSKLKEANLGPDNYELVDMLDDLNEEDDCYGLDWHQCSWIDSLRICGQCAYSDSVPPSAITVAGVVPNA